MDHFGCIFILVFRRIKDYILNILLTQTEDVSLLLTETYGGINKFISTEDLEWLKSVK